MKCDMWRFARIVNVFDYVQRFTNQFLNTLGNFTLVLNFKNKNSKVKTKLVYYLL